MKKFIFSVFAVLSLSATAAHAAIFPTVVKSLDLNSYAGKWYQVASTNPFFQKDCVCATATYTLQEDGNINVVNVCRKGSVNGELSSVEGVAYPTSKVGKLNVVFGGVRLPFSNYWVIEVADDYSYAVVSSPLRTPIWVLSRTPSLPSETLAGIYSRLETAGFPIGSIEPTLQEGCID